MPADAVSDEIYRQTLSGLSIMIDQIRGAFENIDVRRNGAGFYPFEE